MTLSDAIIKSTLSLNSVKADLPNLPRINTYFTVILHLVGV